MSKEPSDNDLPDIMWDAIAPSLTPAKTAEVSGPIELQVELMTPKEIVEELDRTVIGQEEAKQLIAIAAWNRLLSLNNKALNRNKEEFYFEKNNILLLGGTGCGKTHIVTALSRSVALPVTIQDATSFTTSGYIGRDTEDSIEDLVGSAARLVEDLYDTDRMTWRARNDLIKTIAEYGIVYIDEADKVRASSGPGNDVNGRKVQEGFLKIVEGTDIKVKTPDYEGTVNTSNMLFIFGGAFTDIEKIVESRMSVKSIGFTAEAAKTVDKKDIREKVNIKDFTQFGMIPELLGRLSTIAILKDLDREMIAKIFTEPDRSIMSQYINEFKSYGVHVSFTDCAVEHIVDKAMEIKLGARGLKSVCAKVLRPLSYYLPSNAMSGDIIISKELLIKLEERGLC